MVDSPNCVCGGYENIVHFLFYCPRYKNIRCSLFVALGNILLPGVAPHLLVDHIGIDNICSICLYGKGLKVTFPRLTRLYNLPVTLPDILNKPTVTTHFYMPDWHTQVHVR